MASKMVAKIRFESNAKFFAWSGVFGLSGIFAQGVANCSMEDINGEIDSSWR